MHVDRSRFLLLTASLAAAACNQPPAAITPDSGGVDPARSDGSPRGDAGADPGHHPQVFVEAEPGTVRADGQVDAAYDNRIGQPVACDLRPPAGHCESFDMTERLCARIPEVMQPRAAEAAVACMVSANGSARLCEWELWNDCVAAGTQSACVEPETQLECEAIANDCGGSLDVFGCQQTLSAVVAHHRSNAASCIREFCEIGFCVTDIALYY